MPEPRPSLLDAARANRTQSHRALLHACAVGGAKPNAADRRAAEVAQRAWKADDQALEQEIRNKAVREAAEYLRDRFRVLGRPGPERPENERLAYNQALAHAQRFIDDMVQMLIRHDRPK